MTKEAAVTGRDDMLIDESESDLGRGNAIPEVFNANYVKVYYGKLFPHTDIYRWMSYGNDGKHHACDQSFFGRREFSFKLEDDIYLRFQSFNSASEMENAIKEKCPFKIDIGPVCSVDPAKRHAYAQAGDNVFTPVERELVFDIDITDYDDVRYCCSGADVCLYCWPLMTVAIKVLDTALGGEDMIQTILDSITFFGCTVADVVSTVGSVTEKQEEMRIVKKKVSLMGHALHPYLARSYTEVLKDFFEEKLLCSQKLFSNEERYEKLLDMIPDESITSELCGKWQDNRRSSMAKEDINIFLWEQLKYLLQSGKQKALGLRRCVEEIVFSYAYPRLDMEAVFVFLYPNHCEEFDLTTAPTLSKLLGEIKMGLRAEGDNEFDATPLGQSVGYFRAAFLQPLLKSCKGEMESSYSANIEQSRDSELVSWSTRVVH